MSLITDEGIRSAAEMFDLPLINPASVFGKVIIQLFDEVRGEKHRIRTSAIQYVHKDGRQ